MDELEPKWIRIVIYIYIYIFSYELVKGVELKGDYLDLSGSN